MATTETIIIDVQINAEDTVAQLGSVTQRIEELKKKNVDLKNQRKTDTENWGKLTAEIKANELEIKSLQAAEKDLTGAIANSTAARREYSDSFKGQAAQLADLKNQYSSLTRAERESAKGQELLKKLEELDAQVKENDKSMGNFQRNVGNYPEVFDLSGTSIGKFQSMLQGFGGTATSVGGVAGNAFKSIKAQAISLGKAFLTPPIGVIVVILGAIMLAVKKVSDAFKKNDEASTKLQQAFAQFTPIAEAISWIFDKIAVGVATLILGFTKMASAVLKLIPAYKKSADEAERLVLAQDKLEEKEREYTVNSAKRNRDIAKIKKELTQTEKLTAKEREDLAKRAEQLELENLRENKNNLAIKYNNLVAYYKQEKDTSDEAENAKAAALAAYINADTEYFEATTRLASKANAAIKEQNDKREAEEKELQKNRADRLKEEEKQREENVNQLNKVGNETLESLYKIGKREEKIAVEKVQAVRKAINDVPFGVTAENIKKYVDDVTAAEEIIKDSQMDNFDFKMQLLTDEYDAAIANARLMNEDTYLIEQAYSEKKKQLAEQEASAKLDIASQALGNLAQVFGEQTELGKAAAAAQIAIETYKGAMAAYTSLAAYPPLAIAAAATVGLVGAKKIKDVYAVDSKFQDGGIVGGSSFVGDNIIARVNSGEMILNTEQQKKLFGMIATSSNNYSGGFDYEMLAKAISKQPAPVLTYKEFAQYQEKIVTFDEQTKI